MPEPQGAGTPKAGEENAMLFDDLEETEAELLGQVKAACDALAFLEEVTPYEALEAGPTKDAWVRHMNALNTARVRLAMAAEYLHDDLNRFNDQVLAAGHGDYHPGIIERRRTTRSSTSTRSEGW